MREDKFHANKKYTHTIIYICIMHTINCKYPDKKLFKYILPCADSTFIYK